MKGGNIFIGMDPKSILIIFAVLAIFYVIYIIGKFIYSLFSQQKFTNISTENFGKVSNTRVKDHCSDCKCRNEKCKSCKKCN